MKLLILTVLIFCSLIASSQIKLSPNGTVSIIYPDTIKVKMLVIDSGAIIWNGVSRMLVREIKGWVVGLPEGGTNSEAGLYVYRFTPLYFLSEDKKKRYEKD